MTASNPHPETEQDEAPIIDDEFDELSPVVKKAVRAIKLKSVAYEDREQHAWLAVVLNIRRIRRSKDR